MIYAHVSYLLSLNIQFPSFQLLDVRHIYSKAPLL